MPRGRRNQFNFDAEGVFITVPSGSRKLKALSLPIELPASAQAADGIQIIRVLMNVVLIDDDDPNTYLSEFDPPFELKVRYTAQDYKQAQKLGGKLSLAAYVDNKWIRLNADKHKFDLQFDGDSTSGGFGVVQISNWGDPSGRLGYMTDLSSVQIFASFSADELKQLSESLRIINAPEGTVLLKEGETGDAFLIVNVGQVEVVKDMGTPNEKILDLIGPAEYVGEMSLLSSDGLRNASVRTITPSRLWEMTRTEFKKLMLNNPRSAYEVLKQLSQRLNRSQTAIIKELQQKNRDLIIAYDELKKAQAQIVEKERMDRELQVAHEIQISLLPQTIPQLEGFELGAKMEPARQVGGDLYNFIQLDEDHMGIVIGDVTDKGVPAAIFMARVQAIIRAESKNNPLPVDVLRKVNHLLVDNNQQGYFVTVLYGILDSTTGEFNYARAGHELPILCSSSGDAEVLPRSGGQPLGILFNPNLDIQSVTIPTGETLVLYTDEVTDRFNDQNISFGEDKLLLASCGINEISAQEICDHLLSTVIEYRQGKPLQDDVTIVVIKRNRS